MGWIFDRGRGRRSAASEDSYSPDKSGATDGSHTYSHNETRQRRRGDTDLKGVCRRRRTPQKIEYHVRAARLEASLSDSKSESSRTVQETARTILRYLREHPDGASKEALAKRAGVAGVTVQRALKYMRETWDAPAQFNHATKQWQLLDRSFTLPLTDPEPEDLAAVVFAAALLSPLADEELNARVRRLIEQMDEAVEEKRSRQDSGRVRPRAVTATSTTSSEVDSRLISKLATSIGTGVVRIQYESPWANSRKHHDIEPWQLRIHDGSMYLRAFSRTYNEPRSYRVAQIVHARVLPEERPREQVPPRSQLWGSADPGYGIDSDRPGVATLRIRGGVARWVSRMKWDPGQEDRWVIEGELLERKVPYHSCREFARRLLSIVDGLEAIEPPELRDEVVQDAREFLERISS